MNRWLCFPLLTVLTAAAAPAAAQTPSPVSITGTGKVDYFTALPGEFSPFGGEGTFSFMGVDMPYTLTSADVGGLNFIDPGPPAVATFSNSIPVTFASTDPSEPSEISMNYTGEVTLTPTDMTGTQFTAVFIADFTPIAGSGVGLFADVVGGTFEMTAVVSDPFVPIVDPTQTVFTLNSPYQWNSSGGALDVFLVTPEPAAAAMAWVLGLIAAGRPRATRC
ncbi:hypothetical protein Pla123a_21950 [Posidoniimonas polymericola]|uniref:PEP-CTERM protein-sorting domain-containing protein n=1 Tax=Posidoniimonas polymericola TaxID=2528002 RepID=A0A5C5YRF3_9BACT|nr:hypothetical protein [Posidoniimonas polymericola]TWT77534.1 hypothetical protein Pla123a_21950 [Posidoniimonas polymericola]